MTTRIITSNKPKIEEMHHRWHGSLNYLKFDPEEEIRASHRIPEEAISKRFKDNHYDVDVIEFNWFEVTFG